MLHRLISHAKGNTWIPLRRIKLNSLKFIKQFKKKIIIFWSEPMLYSKKVEGSILSLTSPSVNVRDFSRYFPQNSGLVWLFTPDWAQVWMWVWMIVDSCRSLTVTTVLLRSCQSGCRNTWRCRWSACCPDKSRGSGRPLQRRWRTGRSHRDDGWTPAPGTGRPQAAAA